MRIRSGTRRRLGVLLTVDEERCRTEVDVDVLLMNAMHYGENRCAVSRREDGARVSVNGSHPTISEVRYAIM